nr:flagellar basal-body MS-ring/collar protein FliF [uncultured Shimia sp.]
MQKIQSIWSSLNPRRRVTLIVASVASLAAFLGLLNMAASPSMTLLYSGLESGAAGEIIQSLEQRGAKYQVTGGSIYVETNARDELRMTLASEGLPATTTQGYELLDGLTGFGTTSQMFDAAYWRAKEGELARTIVGSPNITSARVHIAHSTANPFQRNVRPTASVTIATTSGQLSGPHAKALKYLIASAVAGLAVEDVAIIDGAGGLVGYSDDQTPNTASQDRTIALRDSIQRLLEARVGYGNAVVEVSIDTVQESEVIRERIFDPSSRVAISTDTEERSTSAKNAGGGVVTVASNLPDGEAGKGNDSENQNSETREKVNYEVSETLRDITREPGAIRRISIAVLVNGTKTQGENGESVVAPRPDAELAVLQDLVESAAGIDSDRGDVVTLRSMIFEPVLPQGTDASTSLWPNMTLDMMSIIQLAVLAVVSLILGLFVVRPMITNSTPSIVADSTTSENALLMNAQRGEVNSPALTGEIADGTQTPDEINSSLALPAAAGSTAPTISAMSPDPVERLRALISDRQVETTEILRSWLEDREEKA